MGQTQKRHRFDTTDRAVADRDRRASRGKSSYDTGMRLHNAKQDMKGGEHDRRMASADRNRSSSEKANAPQPSKADGKRC